MNGICNRSCGSCLIYDLPDFDFIPGRHAYTNTVHYADRVNNTVKRTLGRLHREEDNKNRNLDKDNSLKEGPSWAWDPCKHDPGSTDDDGEPNRVDYLQVLKGEVTSGLGKGEEFVSLDGYQEQFIKKLGYKPYPGTLNITLTEKSTERRARLESKESIPIDSWTAGDQKFGPAQCYPVTIHAENGPCHKRAHVIVPKRTSHDESKLELLSDVKLRDKLNISDGDAVVIITE